MEAGFEKKISMGTKRTPRFTQTQSQAHRLTRCPSPRVLDVDDLVQDCVRKEIVLGDFESAQLEWGASKVRVRARLKYDLFSTPRLYADVALDVSRVNNWLESEFRLTFKHQSYKAYPWHFTFSLPSASQESQTFRLAHDCVHSSFRRCRHIEFHLINAPNFFWKTGAGGGERRPIVAEFGEYELRIEPHCASEQTRRQAGKHFTSLFTHVASVRRRDNEHIEKYDWACLQQFLEYSLGFFAARWVGPVATCGYDENGAMLWADYSLRSSSNLTLDYHWFPRPYPRHLGALLTVIWDIWSNNETKEQLTSAIDMYWQAADPKQTFESRILFSHIALELIAWIIFVERDDMLTSDGFDKLPNRDKISLLLSFAQASNRVPSRFEELNQLCKEKNWTTASQAFAEVRNSIVHPKQKNREKMAQATDRIRFQVSEWSLWLVEISMLRWMGYAGRYQSRVAKENENWPFVPWVDPEQKGAAIDASADD